MKKIFFERLFAIGILFIFISFLAAEGYLRSKNGVPPAESDPPQFKYQHVDIHKKYFEKFCINNQSFFRTIPEKRQFPNNDIFFPAVKGPATLRFFILGESVAEDFSKFPLGSYMGSLVPGKNFEIINCGMGGYDSYRASLIAREIVAYSPDLVIAILGNNENFPAYKINLPVYYLNKFLRRFWLYRNLQDYIAFRKKERRPDPGPVRQRHLRIYEQNIRRIVAILQSRNVPLVLCTVPGNFKDCPPGSEAILNKQFFLASFLLENKDYEGAVNGFQKFLADNPRNEDNRICWYLLGRAYEGKRDYAKAREYYLLARDQGFATDGAGSTSNEIVRSISREKKVILADLDKLFMQVSPNGLCGRELFYDYCHLHPGSNSLFAECIVRAIFENKELNKRLFGKIEAVPEASLSLLLERRNYLALGEVDMMEQTAVWRVFDEEIRRIEFKESVWINSEQILSYFKTLYLMDPQAMWNLQFMNDDITDKFTQNPWIKEFFSPKYKKHSKAYWARLLYYLGETYRRLGEYDKALALFDKSIATQGDDYLPYLGIALTHNALKQPGSIILEDFKRAKQAADNDQDSTEDNQRKKLVLQYYEEFLGL